MGLSIQEQRDKIKKTQAQEKPRVYGIKRIKNGELVMLTQKQNKLHNKKQKYRPPKILLGHNTCK